MKGIKSIFGPIIYIFLNYIVANIPCWHIRKLFYLMFGMRIGNGSRLNMKVLVWNPWKIKIGENTIVNEYALLDGRGGLTIGNGCSIAMWAIVYSSSHYSDSVNFEYYTKPTVIGDCCWICARSIILPGSEIKDRSVIGANSVFKGITNEADIYSGNPCVFVRKRQVDDNYNRQWTTHFR